MTKEVLITVSGLQIDIDEQEAVEVVTVGEYYYRNGKHYLIYDELLEIEEGSKEITKNIIKISDCHIEIIKKGSNNVHMDFSLNEKNTTFYTTPFGELALGMFTTNLEVIEQEEEISVLLEYALDMNYSHLSDCTIQIKVEPQKGVPTS